MRNIDYIGQLENDLADFVAVLRPSVIYRQYRLMQRATALSASSKHGPARSRNSWDKMREQRLEIAPDVQHPAAASRRRGRSSSWNS
jgi:hypothetical protein